MPQIFDKIDESHNLRNREGCRYRAIAEYIAGNDSRVSETVESNEPQVIYSPGLRKAEG